ncbi:MAG TPA: alpha/beta hydrolase [Trebonia sp.]|jgi:pimeloyl-ACP methyl ester carboxylesterase
MPRSRRVAFIACHARVLSAVTAVLAVAAVTACSSAASAQTAATATAQGSTPQASVTAQAAEQADDQAISQTSITRGACPALQQGATRNAKEKCGTVSVPLDYTHPNGQKITVEVSELTTAKAGDFRGYLLLNPGGPGLEGLDMPSTMASELPASVLDDYDLIGFDPRGVGASTPMSCGLSDSTYTGFPYPAADGSITQDVTEAKTIASACAKIGDELQYFTTANTARDMDRIRMALGAQKISYWGQSYGSYLGAVYTSLFPQRTDRMVLEGNVDPDDAWQQQVELWNQGMNDRFPDAAKVAAADNATLGLGSTEAAVTSTFLSLADDLDETPVTVDGTPLNGELFRELTYELLLHNQWIPTLIQVWKAVADLVAGKALTATDGAALEQAFADADPPGEANVPADNQTTVEMALICGDAPWSTNVASYAANTSAARAKYPLSDGMPDDIWACAFWSKPPIEPTVKVTADGPRDVLLLQNQRDNATPYAGALGMARALGDRASLVSVDNGGHYVYDQGSACADQATDTFLTTGALPAKTLSCPAPTT